MSKRHQLDRRSVEDNIERAITDHYAYVPKPILDSKLHNGSNARKRTENEFLKSKTGKLLPSVCEQINDDYELGSGSGRDFLRAADIVS